MTSAHGYSDVIFLRGVHLSCHFSRKILRTYQSAFNDENKNNPKGKCFGSPARQRVVLWILLSFCFPLLYTTKYSYLKRETTLHTLDYYHRIQSMATRLKLFLCLFMLFAYKTTFYAVGGWKKIYPNGTKSTPFFIGLEQAPYEFLPSKLYKIRQIG